MSLEVIKDQKLFFNINFLSNASEAGTVAYRGELVLVEGDAGDSKGHAKPPAEIMRGAVILEKDGKLVMLVGALDEVQLLSTFVEKYRSYFADDIKILLYVVNVSEPMQVKIDNLNIMLIPLVQGVPWNEAMEELGLLKDDFKGQSAADKLVTMYKELVNYTPKSKSVTLDEALAAATDSKREVWGAV